MPLILTGTSSSTTLDSSAGLTFSDSSNQSAAASPFGLKNRVINGDMVISQRGTSAVTIDQTGGTYTLDRWYGRDDSDGAYSIQQVSDAPTGFTNSLKITITTTDSSLSASQYGFIGQWIEGYNIADLSFGTASAKTVTLSFWVKGSVTGQFGGSITNSAQDRSYPFSYTISAANTWEQKTVTITGDTTGTWLTTNGAGIGVNFAVGIGSNFLSTANTWIGSFEMSATGQTNLYATSAATLQFTGVQLERNTTATPFEWIPYSTELALCQRYYAKLSTNSSNTYAALGSGFANSLTTANIFIKYPQTMRSSPTANYNLVGVNDASVQAGVTSLGTGYFGFDSALLAVVTTSGLTTYRPVLLLTNGSASGFIDFSAEL